MSIKIMNSFHLPNCVCFNCPRRERYTIQEWAEAEKRAGYCIHCAGYCIHCGLPPIGNHAADYWTEDGILPAGACMMKNLDLNKEGIIKTTFSKYNGNFSNVYIFEPK